MTLVKDDKNATVSVIIRRKRRTEKLIGEWLLYPDEF